MTLSFGHEHAGTWIGRLIFFLALELNVPVCSGGSTTLKQALRRKGLEPDECFWIKHEKAMRDKTTWNAVTDPPPDLGVSRSTSRAARSIARASTRPCAFRKSGATTDRR